MKYFKVTVLLVFAIFFALLGKAQNLQVDNRTTAAFNDIVVVYTDFSTEQFQVAGNGIFSFPLSGVVDRIHTSGVSLILGSVGTGIIATTGQEVDCSLNSAPGGDKVIIFEEVML